MPRTYLAGVLAATALSFAAAPAMADERVPRNSIEVDISGIDLTTDAGTSLVLNKIETAAKKSCGYRTGPRSLAEIRQTNACIDDAMDGAVASMLDHRARQAALKADKAG